MPKIAEDSTEDTSSRKSAVYENQANEHAKVLIDESCRYTTETRPDAVEMIKNNAANVILRALRNGLSRFASTVLAEEIQRTANPFRRRS